MTTKSYMQVVTAVDPLWLAELGPMFFSVKQSYGNRTSKTQIERQGKEVMEKQMAEEMRRKTEQRMKEKSEIIRKSLHLSSELSFIYSEKKLLDCSVYRKEHSAKKNNTSN